MDSTKPRNYTGETVSASEIICACREISMQPTSMCKLISDSCAYIHANVKPKARVSLKIEDDPLGLEDTPSYFPQDVISGIKRFGKLFSTVLHLVYNPRHSLFAP